MEVELFTFPNKALRAQAILAYMALTGREMAVCFSCGNASKALKKEGVKTLDISATGDLIANRWFQQYEVAKYFPEYFDATSGHIPVECMLDVARRFKEYLKKIPDEIYLPTGSGETLVELKLAFPETRINAVYNLNDATRYDEECVLNGLVRIMANKIIFADKEGIEWHAQADQTNMKRT